VNDSTARPRGELLRVLDEFLRSDPAVLDAFTEFLHHRGVANAAFVASNLVDELSFTAFRE
jgi:hypothetical protein